MWKLRKRSRQFILLLILVAILCLGACTTTKCDCTAQFPIAGENVAQELEKVPYQGYEDFWEWMARLYKLKQELDIQKS